MWRPRRGGLATVDSEKRSSDCESRGIRTGTDKTMFGWSRRQARSVEYQHDDWQIDRFEFTIQEAGTLVIRPKAGTLDSVGLQQVCKRLLNTEGLRLSRIQYERRFLLRQFGHELLGNIQSLHRPPRHYLGPLRGSLMEEPGCNTRFGILPLANQEKNMTTQRRTALAASGLAVVTLAFFVGGCGPETEEAACRRAMNHLEKCLIEATGAGFGVPVSEICEGPFEPVDPNFSAVVDCITSLSCAQLSGNERADGSTTPQCAIAFELIGDEGHDILDGLPGFDP